MNNTKSAKAGLWQEEQHDGQDRRREDEGEAQDEHDFFFYRPRRVTALSNYCPSVATVYSLFREPPLALLGTHLFVAAFHVPVPHLAISYSRTGVRRSGDGNLARLRLKSSLSCPLDFRDTDDSAPTT